MKKSLFTLLVVMLFGTAAIAQTPTTHHFEQNVTEFLNGTMFGELFIDGELITGYDWEIGVYDEDMGLFTGSGLPLYLPLASPTACYSFTYSGNPGDLLTFRLYNHTTGEEVDYVCTLTLTYEMNMSLGAPDDLYPIEFFSQGQDMVFVGQGDWNDLENWENADRLPIALDNVIIAEGAICHMPESAVGQYASLTIEDGGELYAPVDAEIFATVKKNIAAYTNGAGNNWYLLSIPVDVENEDPYDYAAAGMLTGNYDFFMFDQNQELEWRNYKLDEGTPFTTIYNGYLYANSANTTLSFTGILFTAESKAYSRIPYTGTTQLGVNLIGNPYPCKAEVVAGNRINGLFMMNADRDDVMVFDPEGETDFTIIEPMAAMFAIAGANNNAARITFSPYNEEEHEGDVPGIIRGKSLNQMTIEVTANDVLKDRVFVKIGEGESCPKFSLSENSTKIFVPQNNKNYAIAYTEGANVMPMCFTTNESGIYTLNFNTKNMSCSYLHLIDNVTGADIDLFQTPSYTFNSSDSNYANRFKLVFNEEATNEIAESFAFISNGELMINNSGNATLQVMDITGRILSTENIQNCYSKSLNLSAGVYVVRLSNGTDMKAQKIVVE